MNTQGIGMRMLGAGMALGMMWCAASGCATAPRWRTIPLAESRLTAAEPRPSAALDRLLAEAAAQAVAEDPHARIAPGEIWATVIDCRDPRDPRMGSLRGNQPVYPASVVKLCYMLAAYDQHARGLLEFDSAMRRDLQLMIGPSDNAATNRILDRLTNTAFGPELDGAAWDSFSHKRMTVVRYLHELGLDGLTATNKTFQPPAIPLFGRDVQWLGPARDDHFTYSNAMTTDDTARLLYLLARRAVVDPAACDDMLDLMRRKPNPQSAWFGSAIPPGATLYSKDGLTSLELHDAGIFDFGGGGSIILVVFTVRRGEPASPFPRVVPRTAQRVLEGLLEHPAVLDAPQP